MYLSAYKKWYGSLTDEGGYNMNILPFEKLKILIMISLKTFHL